MSSPLPWIKLFPVIVRHPKSRVLARLLHRAEAWPRVVQLWGWASEFAPAGDLSGFDTATIAEAAGWKGSAQAFVDAMTEAGFLDADRRIHDWTEHQPAHVANAANSDNEPGVGSAPTLSSEKVTPRSKGAQRQATYRRNKRDRRNGGDASGVTGDVTRNAGSDGGDVTGDASHESKREIEKEIETKKNTTLPSDSNVTLGNTVTEAPVLPLRVVNGDAKATEPNLLGSVPPRAPAAKANSPEEIADRNRYRDEYRRLYGQPKAEFGGGGVMAFRRVRGRYGLPDLLRALNALRGDERFGATLGLDQTLAEACIQKGLNLANGAGGSRSGTNGRGPSMATAQTGGWYADEIEAQMQESSNGRV